MNIWLDNTPLSLLFQDKSDDCDCSGDCDIVSTQLLDADSSQIGNNTQAVHTGILQLANPLHTQTCHANHWLACNPTATGQVAVIDSEAYTLLNQFRKPATLREVSQRNNGYAPATLAESIALFYKLGFLQDTQQPAPIHQWGKSETLTAWLHVTNACNLRCQYCYLGKTQQHISPDTAQRAVDAVFRSAKRQHFQRVKLKYAGGEASLHLARVIEVHDYAAKQAQQQGMAFSALILSNGVALSQRTIDQLKERHIGVTISLDGIESYHDSQRPFINGQGSFKYVDRTITRLLDNGVIPHITVTVSRRNLDGLPDLMQYILERELPFSLSYYRDNEYSTELHDLQFADKEMIAAMQAGFAVIERNLPRRKLLDSLIDKANLSGMHRHTCGVGQNYLVIDQDGGVAKCQADIKRRITTIDADDPLQAVRDDRTGVQGVSVDEKEGCRTCDWRYWCAGGCPLLTYRVTGRYDIKSPNCNIYKALFPEALRLEALRLLKYESPIIL